MTSEYLAEEISQRNVLDTVISVKCQLDYVPLPRSRTFITGVENAKHSRNALRSSLSAIRSHLDQKEYKDSMRFDQFKELDFTYYDFALRAINDSQEDYHVTMGN